MRGKRVYFDAMIFIYLVEGFPQLRDQILDIRDSLLNAESAAFTSDLTLCETLVVPFRRNDAKLVAQYREFIEASGAFEVRPTTRDTYIRAGLYRAEFGLRTPDAIHVATAVEANCELFVTNDRPLKTPRGLEIALLRQL